MPTLLNVYKDHGHKQHKLLSDYSGGQKSQSKSTDYSEGVSEPGSNWKDPGRRYLPVFSKPKKHHTLASRVPLSICIHCHILFCRLTRIGLSVCMRPPRWSSLHCSSLPQSCLIIPTKSLLSWKVPYSQILETQVWTTLEKRHLFHVPQLLSCFSQITKELESPPLNIYQTYPGLCSGQLWACPKRTRYIHSCSSMVHPEQDCWMTFLKYESGTITFVPFKNTSVSS